ncbi:sensor histidine kinase [Brevibacillus sp. HD3.3A]|uniref:sensor histidine kinase n=1 Tax=Brevibacillus sp. HD3.3A TaxID=2738979 RepID=UPI00156B24DA|nr:sensor histidine kinase [Brevibacillus sp. HD3.3A]UED69446.1 ATP-binding protein [Brevibacillus sp. HD3.3A]
MARFRTKARAVDLLGKQQIRDEVTAISELLRNSFDADASEGLIDVSSSEDRIIVWDDGDGMSEEDLINNWLTIGTYSKYKSHNTKTRKGRIKIGEKGIGRLAISLLGDQLLVLSKKRDVDNWSLLYLHWGLFRNEKLFLEEIELPTKTFTSLEEMRSFIKFDLATIKEDLKKNLADQSKWENKTAIKISQEIDQFTVSDSLFKRVNVNERRGGGTTFYIHNLDNQWDWNVYKLAVEDESRRERKRRLENVLVSFTNLIDLFDKKEDGKHENAFYPKIHIDGLKLENKSWFNPEDIQLYDYALKGTINNGKFSGQAFIRSTKTVEVFDITEIDLTFGIHTESIEMDCGPVEIKWFFVEGRDELTSLTKEQLEMMKDKLLESGGIYVFRDGLRILPYGEPGNDFLRIEERRSKGAGYYLFSHRRMYGFMEISKTKNPDLVDKSSREGFVENNAYKYFVTTAQNLLVWWARDFLESQKETGRRAIRIKRLQDEREKDTRLIQQQREEEKREKEYFRALNESIKNFTLNNKSLYLNIRQQIDSKISQAEVRFNHNRYNKYELNENLYQLRKNLYDLTDDLYKLRVNYNRRYFHESELMDQIDQINVKIFEQKEELKNYIDDGISLIKIKELEEQESTNNHGSTDNDVLHWTNKIHQAIDWKRSKFTQMVSKVIDQQIDSLKEELSQITYEITQLYINELTEKRKNMLSPLDYEIEQKCSQLEGILEKFTTFDYLFNSEAVKLEAETVLMEYEKLIENAQNELLNFANLVKDMSITKNNQELITDIKHKLSQNLDYNSDNEYIGFLKKEVGMYRDLSAVGLAAELTSHEFNALYSTIQENLNILYKSLNQTKALPVVEKTRNAFKSLERLHQRMNPLYRQVRARKQKITIKNFVGSVLEYFESDLRRYKIKTEIHLSDDFIVKENDSVLFTPVVNIVANAIYWLLNQSTKEIHFYSSPTSLFIHDTGQGIDPKDHLRIFDPFFTRKSEGRGLGLFLSRDILESRGHKLFLVSPEDQIFKLSGACFCIQFNNDALEVE